MNTIVSKKNFIQKNHVFAPSTTVKPGARNRNSIVSTHEEIKVTH